MYFHFHLKPLVSPGGLGSIIYHVFLLDVLDGMCDYNNYSK